MFYITTAGFRAESFSFPLLCFLIDQPAAIAFHATMDHNLNTCCAAVPAFGAIYLTLNLCCLAVQSDTSDHISGAASHHRAGDGP